MNPPAHPVVVSMKRRVVMRAVGTAIFCQVRPLSIVLAMPGPPPVQAATNPTSVLRRWIVASERGVAPDVGESNGWGDWSTAVDVGATGDANTGEGLAPSDWLTHPPAIKAASARQVSRPVERATREWVRPISTPQLWNAPPAQGVTANTTKVTTGAHRSNSGRAPL